uniref:Hedgehog acyltransferase n=1 Tax=Eptatretus burgeri TaxID=7764 RepID=A0A8C4R3B1_EPTBU
MCFQGYSSHRTRTLCLSPLLPLEKAFYLANIIVFHLLLFFLVHVVSKEYEEVLGSNNFLEEGFPFLGIKKDVSDFEWTFWSHWASHGLLWLLLGHVILSWLTLHLMAQLRLCCWLVYGMWGIAWLLGFRGLLVMILYALASYVVSWWRSASACWLCNTPSRCGSWTHLARTAGHASMTRLVSPMLAAAQSSTLFWFLLFIFYLPPLPNGPIVCFSDFVAQVKMPNQRRDQDGLAWAVRRMSRLVCWWLLAETMLHVLHSSAFLHHTQLLQSLSPAVLGGIALAQVSFFYVKYLVLFGLPSLVMCLDGLKPPPLPRCVTLTYSFTAIWRTFDTGLHQWLVRYIYLPLGGSQTGTLRLLLASAATFAFVAAWHGGQKDLLLWAGVNWLGVLMEYGVRSLCSKPCVKSWLSAALHPLSLRRATGLLTAVATIITIWSNLIFFAGTHVGEIYFKMFLAGGPWVLGGMLAFLYCCAQLGMEWENLAAQNHKGSV